MRANSLGTDSNNGYNRTYSSTLNKSSAFNNSSKPYYNLNHLHHVNSTDEFSGSQTPKKYLQSSNEVLYSPSSFYDNYCSDINQTDIELNATRRSRPHNKWEDINVHGSKELMKRDLSMPPINGRERQTLEDNICSQYAFSHHKYSIDGDLNVPLDDSNTDLYDSVIASASATPPPVNMVHEYANRKAIIRPLAFRPVKSDRSQNVSESSPTKPPPFMKNKNGQVRRASPPPVPPHSGRVPLKSNIGRVQSLKSGDSSGYYSSRTVCTVNGNTSSTDISPTFDDNGSMMDSIMTGEIYANTADLINDYQTVDGTDQEPFVIQPSLESEISAEKERCKSLENALFKSNAKLLYAEGQINDLKMRLSQKSSEVNNAKDSLALVKRNLEHQSQKTHSLEKSIKSLQAIKYDRGPEIILKEKTTQTNLYNNDHTAKQLLEQFEEERRTWLDEKLKVLTYQKQIESNFQKLVMKYRRLEAQLHPRGQKKESRSQHAEDHEKSSLNSGDSANRNYFPNINRADSAEQQSSF